ncbi:MAG: GNAT family N-acetyltransferase [Bacteroidales bacterium]|nr:GNAT family N-acetyltransferase [Bacteroidales bacterium]MBN2758656.1 GNAT family N-acetyltransferase [Bacteroidales bacterium]
MQLIFKQIVDTNNIIYDRAISIYNNSFPENEKQLVSVIKNRIDEAKSHLFVGILKTKVVCMALLWEFNNSEFILLEYLAVKENQRNKNYGSKILNFIIDKVKINNKYLIIEVENYLFGNNIEQRKKRINFYIKNGAYILNNVPYLIPSLNNTLATETLLMLAPKYHKLYLKKHEVDELIRRLYVELYQKSENDKMLNSILEKITDKINLTNNII